MAASKIICSVGYIEGSMNITINRDNNNYTHTLTYTFGSLKGTIITKTDKTYCSWSIPSSFYAQIPNSNSTTMGTVTCQTYNGNSLIGSVTTNVTIKTIKEKCQPTLDPMIQDIKGGSTALTGNNLTMIKGYNTLICNAYAQAKNSATIKEIKITCGNTTIIGDDVMFEDNVTSNKFTFTATDSRGYSSSVVYTMPMVEYIPISAAVKSIKLAADGTLTFTLSGTCYSGSFGAVDNDVSIQYRLTGRGTEPQPWVEVADKITAVGSFTKEFEITGLDYTKTYSINLKWSDSLTETFWEGGATVSCIPTFDWGENDFRVNKTLTIPTNLTINGVTADGNSIHALQACNNNNNLVLGYGGYINKIGATNIYGNSINMTTNTGIVNINGRQYGANKVLWSGAYWMTEAQTANLSETVAAQPNGIVLVFSFYGSSGAENKVFHSFFIPKSLVAGQEGMPHCFFLNNTTFSYVASKYLYIYNNKITGHENNDGSGTGSSGIKYNNSNYVLRYVIGV